MSQRAMSGLVHGRVQGVGFRYATRAQAGLLGVTGWVANRPDGSVQVWAQGPPDAVARFVAFLREGPRQARVESVELDDVIPDETLVGFNVRF
jgi:acylphosphatase